MKVKIIARKNQSVLIQWIDKETNSLKRTSVPVDSLAEIKSPGEETYCDVAEMGPSWGMPWAVVLKDVQFNPEEMERQLHKSNIWTVEDLFGNPEEVLAAAQSALGSIAQDIRARALKYTSDSIGGNDEVKELEDNG